jgi:hypothetical protein
MNTGFPHLVPVEPRIISTAYLVTGFSIPDFADAVDEVLSTEHRHLISWSVLVGRDSQIQNAITETL